MNCPLRLVSLVVLLALGMISQTIEAQKIDYRQYLPGRTIAFVSVKDTVHLGEQWKENPLLSMIQEESVRKFFAKPLARLQEEMEKELPKIGIPSLDTLDICQGQVLLAFTGLHCIAGEDNQSIPVGPQLLLLIETGEKKAKATELLEQSCQRAEKEGLAVILKQEFLGQTICYLKPAEVPREDVPGEVHHLIQQELCYCMRGDLLMIGLTDEALKSVLTQLAETGSGDRLGESPIYLKLTSRCLPGSDDVSLYLNLEAMWEALHPIMGQGEKQMLSTVLNVLGLARMRGFGMGASLGKTSLGQGFFFSPGPHEGVMNLILHEDLPALLPDTAPTETVSYTAWRLSLAQLWELMETLIRTLSPHEFEQLQEELQAIEKKLEFQFKKDFVPTVGNEWRFVKDLKRPLSLLSERTTFSISLADPQKFCTYLDKMLALAPPSTFESKEYLGNTIYSIKQEQYEGMPEPYQDMAKDPPAFGIVNQRFVFSSKRSGLENVVSLSNRGENLLKDAQVFQNLLKRFPGRKDSLYYSNLYLEFEHFFSIIDSVKQLDTSGWFDWSLLPAQDVLRKYVMLYDLGYMRLDDDGLYFLWQDVKEELLKD